MSFLLTTSPDSVILEDDGRCCLESEFLAVRPWPSSVREEIDSPMNHTGKARAKTRHDS